MTTEKSRSRRNALKFGIFANVMMDSEVSEESKEHFLTLLAGMRKSFRPANPFAELLIEKLAVLYVRLSCLHSCDLQTAPILFSKVKESIENDEARVEREYIGEPKKYQVVVVPRGPSPELLLKYESNLERQIARTVDQIKPITGASEQS